MSQLNISTIEAARGAVYLIGGLGLTMGFRAILQPTSYVQSFGFDASTRTAQTASSNPFVIAAGGRTIASALSLIGCAYLKADRATGMLLCTAIVVGVVDAYIVSEFGGPGELEYSGEGQTSEESADAQRERIKVVKLTGAGHALLAAAFFQLGKWMLTIGA